MVDIAWASIPVPDIGAVNSIDEHEKWLKEGERRICTEKILLGSQTPVLNTQKSTIPAMQRDSA
jgi:hypothetical protein